MRTAICIHNRSPNIRDPITSMDLLLDHAIAEYLDTTEPFSVRSSCAFIRVSWSFCDNHEHISLPVATHFGRIVNELFFQCTWMLCVHLPWFLCEVFFSKVSELFSLTSIVKSLTRFALSRTASRLSTSPSVF
jgi:hypothetical protein